MFAIALLLLAPQTQGDWHIRYDRAGVPDSAMTIAVQAPGWHITTARNGSGIAYKPAQTATGNFTATLESILFPSAGHMDGYGMILGGQGLDGPGQSYLYFLVRGDGQFLIKHRAGTATHDVTQWAPNAAIAKQEGSANARNTLAVQARADSVIFMVNGQRVHALARSPGLVDGIVGLRINHGLTVHATRLDVRPAR